MAQALTIGEVLGSGAEGIIHRGKLGRVDVVVKLSHIEPDRDVNDLVRERLAFAAAIGESPFFSQLLQVTVLPDYEFKHPMPAFMKNDPTVRTDAARRKKYPWYFALHEGGRPVLQEVYTPVCKETAAAWLKENFGNTTARHMRECYSYLAQHAAAAIAQKRAGWYHADMHRENVMCIVRRGVKSVASGVAGIDIPLVAGRQWMAIDYGDVYEVGTKPRIPAHKNMAANPHVFLASALGDVLFQPFWWQARRDGKAADFPPPRVLARKLIKKNPALDMPVGHAIHAELDALAFVVIARAVRLDPDAIYEALGLIDVAPYSRLLETHKKHQVIPEDDFRVLCRHVCNPRAMLKFLVARLAE